MIVTTTPTIEGRPIREHFGVDIDYETVGANGSMLMVSVSGTAAAV